MSRPRLQRGELNRQRKAYEGLSARARNVYDRLVAGKWYAPDLDMDRPDNTVRWRFHDRRDSIRELERAGLIEVQQAVKVMTVRYVPVGTRPCVVEEFPSNVPTP